MTIFRDLGWTILLAMSAALSGCAQPSIPSGVPSGASVHWSDKEGFYWTWIRNSNHGCVAWMAMEEWASALLLVGTRCDSKPQSELAGRGLSYSTVEDHLTFQGRWPWSEEDYSKLIVFDDKGMISRVRPCPYSLSGKQIDGMRLLAHEAGNLALTDAEKRVLVRIDQLLSELDGKALSSGQGGCTDLPIDTTRIVRDVWTNH